MSRSCSLASGTCTVNGRVSDTSFASAGTSWIGLGSLGSLVRYRLSSQRLITPPRFESTTLTRSVSTVTSCSRPSVAGVGILPDGAGVGRICAEGGAGAVTVAGAAPSFFGAMALGVGEAGRLANPIFSSKYG